MIKITKAQRTALEAARDFGDANSYAYTFSDGRKGGMSHPYRVSRFEMLHRMKREGLLATTGNGRFAITEAGLAALGA